MRRYIDPRATTISHEAWRDTRKSDWREDWDAIPAIQRSLTPMIDRLHKRYDDDVVAAWLTRSYPR
jgi:hypothetical protein